MKSLVSIVVPVYNAEKFVNKCVDSIMTQTYKNIEVILINDGSTDLSGKICSELSQDYINITSINIKNGGVSNARNVGIKLSKGEFIVFLDVDDFFEKDMIKTALDNIKSADLCMWNYFVDFLKNEHVISSHIPKIDSRTLVKNRKKKNELSKEIINSFGYVWNKMYRTEMIKQNSFKFFSDVSLGEDMIFNTILISKCSKIAILDKPYTHYCHRDSVSLGKKYLEGYFDLKLKIINSIEKMLNEWNVSNSNNYILELKYNAIKSSILMILENNKFSYKEKISRLEALIKRKDYKNIVNNYNPIGFKNKIIHTVLRTKNKEILYFLNIQRNLIKHKKVRGVK